MTNATHTTLLLQEFSLLQLFLGVFKPGRPLNEFDFKEQQRILKRCDEIEAEINLICENKRKAAAA